MSGAAPLGHSERPESRQMSCDAIEALHDEIERLPERYQTAIVLCDLQGLTHEEAARGWVDRSERSAHGCHGRGSGSGVDWAVAAWPSRLECWPRL